MRELNSYDLFKRGFNTQEIMVMLGLSSEAVAYNLVHREREALRKDMESRRKKSDASREYWRRRRVQMREARAGA
jgi:hypothetical protein